MKIFYRILFIVFIFTALLVTREDVVSVLGNISSSFNKNVKTGVVKLTEKENLLPKKIDMPGALRVVDSIISANSKVDLTRAKIISLTNKYRKDNANLSALIENKKLDLSAEKKLQDMFDNQYFEHISPHNIGVGDLGEEVGYDYILIGENLAMGNFKDDQALLDAWIASEGHRENIVNKNYTEIGVAVGKGTFEGKEIWMAVQHFGTPRSTCPLVDEVLYGDISINQNKIKEMEVDLVTRLDMINKGAVYEGKTKNEQIDIYNNLVNIYNDLIKSTKEKINNYNTQIRTFNNCLAKYQ